MSQELPIALQASEAKLELAKKGQVRLLITAMRPHQWTKNLFIFAPLLLGRKMADPVALWHTVLAFLAFCLLSSGMYIFNDWLDADDDRAHPEKRYRPISSGQLSIPFALLGCGVLVTSAFVLAALLGAQFFFIAALYCVITMAYCVALKKAFVLDGMIIATGFVLRVVGGAVAAGVMASKWLIVCAFLLALFLAYTKRRQELLTLSSKAAGHRQVLGEYTVTYIEQLNNIILGAAIVCYTLYTLAPETVEKFGTESLLYGTVFVIYGMFRYMALIKLPTNGDNPSKLLLRDRPLLLTVAGWAAYNAIVIYSDSLYSVWTSITASGAQ